MAMIDAELRTVHTIGRRVLERAAIVRETLPHEGGESLNEAMKMARDAASLWEHATKIVELLTKARKRAAAEAAFEESPDTTP